MRKYKFLYLTIFAIIVFIELTGKLIAKNFEYFYINATSGINVRSGPSTDYSVVDKIGCGTRVILKEKQNNWAFINFSIKQNTKEGWVFINYIQVKKPSCKKKVVIVGKWKEVVPGMSSYDHTIIITKVGSEYFIEKIFDDGSSGSKKLIKYISGGEYRFREEDNHYGEYYKIGGEPYNFLYLFDKDGPVRTDWPIK